MRNIHATDPARAQAGAAFRPARRRPVCAGLSALAIAGVVAAGSLLAAGPASAATNQVTLTSWADLINPAVSGATVQQDGTTYDITLAPDTDYLVTGQITIPATAVVDIDASGDTLTRDASLTTAYVLSMTGATGGTGSLAFHDGTIDGAGVSSTSALVKVQNEAGLTIGASGETTVLENAVTSGTGGSAVFVASASLTVTDATVENSKGGSALYANEAPSVTVTGSTVSDNTGGSGPALRATVTDGNGAAVTLVDDTFDGNTSSGTGGAVYVTDYKALKIGGTTTFSNNTTSGGAAGALVVRAGNGGTIDIGTDAGDKVVFQGNSTTNATNGNSGAVSLVRPLSAATGIVATVGAGTSFIDNSSARNGGALDDELLTQGSLAIDGATFDGNSAVMNGGALMAGAPGNAYGATSAISLTNVTLTNNTAGSGGAGYGGAIQILGGLLQNLTVTDSTFSGNHNVIAPVRTADVSDEFATIYAANVSGSTTDNQGPSNATLYNDFDIQLRLITVDPSNGTTVTGTGPGNASIVVLGPDGKPLTDASGNPLTGTIAADGTYSVTIPSGALNSDGTPYTPADGQQLSVVQWDPSSSAPLNVQPNGSTPATVSVDATAPAAPDAGKVTANGGSVTGGAGAAEPGSTVTVTDGDGNVVGTGTVGDDGSFDVTLSPAAADGQQLSVTLTDPSGNTSGPTAVTVDASAPAAPDATKTTSDGTSVSGGAGAAEPGSTVTVTDGDGNVVGTGTVGDDGSFEVTLNPAAADDGQQLSVTVTDPSGNTSDPTTVTADTTAPSAPDAGKTTSNGTSVNGGPGAGEPGSTITVTDGDGNVIGTGTVGDDGSFAVELDPAAKNGDALTVTATDPSGNVSDPTTVTADTKAPAAPDAGKTTSDGNSVTGAPGAAEPGSTVTVTDGDGNVVGTGTVGDDGSFDVALNPAATDGQQVSVTVTDPSGNTSDPTKVTADSTAPSAPDAGKTTSNGTSVTGEAGAAEPGSTVTVTDGDGNVIGSGKVGDDGSFQVALNPAATDGQQVSVTVTDPSGNTSDPTTVTADTTAPAAPDAGKTTSDGSTVTGGPGAAEPGSTVTVTDGDGKVIGTGTVGDDGSFTVKLDPAVKDGASVTVTVTDPSGNVSDPTTVTADVPKAAAPADKGAANSGPAPGATTPKSSAPTTSSWLPAGLAHTGEDAAPWYITAAAAICVLAGAWLMFGRRRRLQTATGSLPEFEGEETPEQ